MFKKTRALIRVMCFLISLLGAARALAGNTDAISVQSADGHFGFIYESYIEADGVHAQGRCCPVNED